LKSSFSQLQPGTQHALSHGLGWRELRPVQELSIPAIHSGKNCLILAPTAGGKTEAAMIPVLDLLVRDRTRPVGALYLSPLKALVNNQEERLAQLFGFCQRRVFKWHGDVTAARKKAFLKDPADLLMTTPESLEVLLTASGPPALPGRRELLQDLRVVVLDEVHAFAGDDRGDHLLCLLERLGDLIGRELQRIGLSATVGNPDFLLEWLGGGELVDPGRPKSKRKLEILPLSPFESPGLAAARLAQGKKTLLFAESRSRTEELKTALQDHGVTTYVHHSAISREAREESERAFARGRNCCIVCTSTMELGLDVGDLDLVLQYHSPATVSAFLQRLGRTGRRADTAGHMAFLTDEGWSFLQVCALIELARRGWVEPIEASPRSLVVFLHQMLARVVSEGSVAVTDLLAGVGRPYCFSELSRATRRRLLDHLLEQDYFLQADGAIVLGTTGERRLSKNHFQDLYSIFDTPRSLKVINPRGQEVGNIDAWFAQSLGEQGKSVFALGGRSWVPVRTDWENSILYVEPAASGRVATWMGTPRLLSRKLCEEMHALLRSQEPVPFLSERGARTLQKLRDEWRPHVEREGLNVSWDGEWCTVYTFAGGKINNLLGKAFQHQTGVQPSINNVQIKARADVARWDQTLEAVRAGHYRELQHHLVQWLPRARFSKYQDLLPPELLEVYLAERLLDLPGAEEIAAQPLRIRVSALH